MGGRVGLCRLSLRQQIPQTRRHKFTWHNALKTHLKHTMNSDSTIHLFDRLVLFLLANVQAALEQLVGCSPPRHRAQQQQV